MTVVDEVVVPARCCGPSASGNGGWSSGAVAAHVRSPVVEVMLRLPPPLDTPLTVTLLDPDRAEVHDPDGNLVAEAKPGALIEEPPAFVSIEDAARASMHYPGLIDHAFPHCFSCGPERDVGDGLRIFPGPLGDGLSPMAAVVHAGVLAASPTDAVDGMLCEPVVWAVLDCPSGWPCIAAAARPMVLGRMTAEILAPVPADDLVVVGAELWSQRRKHAGASALYAADGTLLARAETLWIELPD